MYTCGGLVQHKGEWEEKESVVRELYELEENDMHLMQVKIYKRWISN